MCVATPTDCGDVGDVFMECDGPEDCATGLCCVNEKVAGPPEGVFCSSYDAPFHCGTACHTDADCASLGSPPEHCVPVGAPYPDTLKQCL
jgi:hypothetical protein